MGSELIYKIEELGKGYIYCLIFDVMYPGKIQLNKVKKDPKYEVEYIYNFKILEQGFK